MNPMKSEPAVTIGTVTGAIGAGVVMLVTLGVIDLSQEQQNALMAFVVAAAPIIAGIIIRSRVTPVE